MDWRRVRIVLVLSLVLTVSFVFMLPSSANHGTGPTIIADNGGGLIIAVGHTGGGLVCNVNPSCDYVWHVFRVTQSPARFYDGCRGDFAGGFESSMWGVGTSSFGQACDFAVSGTGDSHLWPGPTWGQDSCAPDQVDAALGVAASIINPVLTATGNGWLADLEITPCDQHNVTLSWGNGAADATGAGEDPTPFYPSSASVTLLIIG